MTDIIVQAATDAALTALLIEHGILVVGESGARPAPGVTHSHIGGAEVDGVALAGRYAFVGLDDAVMGESVVSGLLSELAPDLYTGPAVRMRLGGANYDVAGSVPRAVTMRQARLALLGSGKLPAVTAAINSLPEPQKSAAMITWEYSTQVQRDNGLVPQMAAALGMTEAQIDALFIAAAKL
jgi:hypothetical protein